MNKVVMYSKDYCPYCARAKALLEQRGVTDLEIIQIDREPGQRDRMIERTGRRTVPQIFIGDTHVGAVSYTHLDVYKRQRPTWWTPGCAAAAARRCSC